MNGAAFQHWITALAGNKPSPLVMGILNLTPNSFSDGGRFLTVHQAYDQAQTMINQGASFIDIGGEASNPSSQPISVQEELDRVLPVIEKIRTDTDICLSIDTYKPAVMQAAIAAGANIINDIKALQEPQAMAMAAKLQVPVCLMHMQGLPATMQLNPHYPLGVVAEINQFFEEKIATCLEHGLLANHLILDPGIGFGKSLAHNLSILKNLALFKQHGLPILLGASRKQCLGSVVNKPVQQRLIAGIAVAIHAMKEGVAIIRTHDVDETQQALAMIKAIDSTEGHA